MTIEQLIEELKKFPPDTIVYRDNGDYNGDYVVVHQVKQLNDFGKIRLLID